MSQSFLRGAAALAVLLVMSATVLFAQGVITDIKTRPMLNSETTIIPIAIHNTVSNPSGGIIGWVGALMKVHILDATELNVDRFHSIHPSTIHFNGTFVGNNPGGTVSNRIGPFAASTTFSFAGFPQSSPLTFSLITPNWRQSGQNVTASVNKFLGTMTVHAKGSSGDNSDVDATFMFWNIWHVRPGTSSGNVTLKVSDRVLAPSSITNQGQLHFGPFSTHVFAGNALDPLDPANHWLHITTTAPFHLSTASVIFATFLNTATLGIEHVPEPATWALMVLGLVALAVGLRMRRKRLVE